MLSVVLVLMLLQPAESIDYGAFPGFKYLEKTEMNPKSSPIPASKPRSDLDPVKTA
jgi:hypothetical protein